jgi:hypothetical protein
VNRHITTTLSFIAVLAAVVGMLKLFDWMPDAFEPGLMRRYPNVEAAASDLGIRGILVPTYFPETLGWPPTEVLAQTEPFKAVIMSFSHSGDGGDVLVISQAWSSDFRPDPTIRFRTVNETIPLVLAGRKATLEAGQCLDQSPCSRISWTEGKIQVLLTMKAPSPELIRIAESMLN